MNKLAALLDWLDRNEPVVSVAMILGAILVGVLYEVLK